MMHKHHTLRQLQRDWVINEHEGPIPHHSGACPLITWAGHATFLLQVGGVSILTDPIFGDPSWLFPRLAQSVLDVHLLPHIDAVLLSHNHPDHMDERTLLALLAKNPRTAFYVPAGDGQWFKDRGFLHVYECTWWDRANVTGVSGGSVEVVFLPAHHWSGRGVFDWNRSLWGSWMVTTHDHTVYFAGDTAYATHFKQIAREFPHIDTALMPVGPCEPDYAMKNSHMNPEEAGQAFLDLNARWFVPMHWGAYLLGTDHPLLPIERLQRWWRRKSQYVKNKTLRLVKCGQSFVGTHAS